MLTDLLKAKKQTATASSSSTLSQSQAPAEDSVDRLDSGHSLELDGRQDTPEDILEGGSEDESEDEFEDVDWNRLRCEVGLKAEALMEAQPSQPLEAALLRALWSIERDYAPSLVVRYQILVADGLAEPREEDSDAAWWLGEAPEDLDLLGCL